MRPQMMSQSSAAPELLNDLAAIVTTVCVMITVRFFSEMNNHVHLPANAKQQFPGIHRMKTDCAQIFTHLLCKTLMILKVNQNKKS